jgi:hypothetical protein
VIVKNLGARTTGTGIAHHPEVVGGVARALVVANADHPLGGHADLFGPDCVGFVVLGIDGHPQPICRQAIDIDEQFPGVADRIQLEVIAEGEIAEHFEKSMVTRRVADIFEVVVLATGANALLGRRRPLVGTLVETEKDILELVHAGVGEQQRRVVMRHQRTRCDDLVAFGCKELEELLANFGAAHGGAFHRRPYPLGVVQKLRF